MEIANDIIGSVIIRTTRVDSTSSHLKKMAAQLQEGAVVVTDNQTHGKGRYGHSWFSDSGSVVFSLLIRPRLELSQLPLTALFPAVSIARALRAMKVSATIKWPNDLEIEGRKIGGILVENTVKSDRTIEIIIGIGLNVNQIIEDFPCEIRHRAASLRSQTNKVFDKEEVLATLLHFLNVDYQRFFNPLHADAVKAEWLSLCGHRNASVNVTCRGQIIQGKFIELTDTGAAVLNVDGRQVVVDNFDIFEEPYAADD